MAFLEAPRFPEPALVGGTVRVSYNNTIVGHGDRKEEVNINWDQALRTYTLGFVDDADTVLQDVVAFFNAVSGGYDGFRVKDPIDYATADTVTATDASLGAWDGSTTAYQLRKDYTVGALKATRYISKPVSGTVLFGVGGVRSDIHMSSVDATTGIIIVDTTVEHTNSSSIISLEESYSPFPAPGVLITPNDTAWLSSLSVNDSLYVSGVNGMTELNGNRYRISHIGANLFVLDVDVSGFTAYDDDGSGDFTTLIQSGEELSAGCEFDVPCRFVQDNVNLKLASPTVMSADTIQLQEERR